MRISRFRKASNVAALCSAVSCTGSGSASRPAAHDPSRSLHDTIAGTARSIGLHSSRDFTAVQQYTCRGRVLQRSTSCRMSDNRRADRLLNDRTYSAFIHYSLRIPVLDLVISQVHELGSLQKQQLVRTPTAGNYKRSHSPLSPVAVSKAHAQRKINDSATLL